MRPYEQALSFVRQLGATAADDGSGNTVSTPAGAGTDLLKQLAVTGSGSGSSSSSRSSSRSETGTDLVSLLGGDLLDVVLRNDKPMDSGTGSGGGGGMVWMDPKTVNFAVYSSVPKDRRLDKVPHNIHNLLIHCSYLRSLPTDRTPSWLTATDTPSQSLCRLDKVLLYYLPSVIKFNQLFINNLNHQHLISLTYLFPLYPTQ